MLAAAQQLHEQSQGDLPRPLSHPALVQPETDLRDLAEDPAIEPPVLLDPGAHLLEQRADDEKRRARRVRERVAEHALVVRDDLLGDRLQQGVLRAEVVEDGGPRDPGLSGDLRHGHVVDAAPREQPARGIDDARPLGAALPGASVGRRLHVRGESVEHWTRV